MKKHSISLLSAIFILIVSVVVSNHLLAQNKPKTDSLKNVKQTKIVEVTPAVDVVDSVLINNPKVTLFKANGVASYYAEKFNKRKTASGAIFDNNKLTAAHKKLPFGTVLRVTNPVNKKSVIVVVNDRGPYAKGREIDLSRKAFMSIATNKNSGVLKVTLEILVK
jgi:rare lipoprotein A